MLLIGVYGYWYSGGFSPPFPLEDAAGLAASCTLHTGAPHHCQYETIMHNLIDNLNVASELALEIIRSAGVEQSS